MKKQGLIRLLFIIFFLVVFLFDILLESNTNEFMVFFLDVGQGESTLIRSPEGGFVLIDTGPGKDALEELGKYFPISESKIDLLIISHFDKDHTGGLAQLLETYDVQNVVFNENDPDLNQNMLSQLGSIPKLEVSPDIDFKLGCCVNFNWLDTSRSKLDSNTQSIALRLDYNDFNIFFGGDLPADEENRISAAIGDIDLLKVSHHGSSSSTSSMFLDNIKPEFAIISVGINNSYDHPHQQVLDNLEHKKVEIRRTDLLGTQVLIASVNQFELISTEKCKYYCNYRLNLKRILF